MKAKQYLLCLIALYSSRGVMAQCGTTNQALNKTVQVSSVNAGGAGPYHLGPKAVDGSMSSSWTSQTNTNNDNNATDFIEWIYVDLGQTYSVCGVSLYWENNNQAKNFKVQISGDLASWTDMSTVQNNSAISNVLTVSGSGRYVRLYATRLYVSWSVNYGLLEMEVYNSTGNQLPAVSITSPANNDVFNYGVNIPISATASDADGTISKVEFYDGATKLGEDLSSPYAYTWTGASSGAHTLTAVATDNGNGQTTSSAINITVNNQSSGSGNGWSLAGNTGTNPATDFLGTLDNQPIVFKTNSQPRLSILEDGKVKIGNLMNGEPDVLLSVDGAVFSRKVKVTQNDWADFVFAENYQLPALDELEKFIRKWKHLPGIPDAQTVTSQALDLGEMQSRLLQKVEELTLYIIELNKKLDAQQREIDRLKDQQKKQE